MNARGWFSSLRVQIFLLMALALFPLGAIAIYQTNRVAETAEKNAELALLAVTGRAAKREELMIERAFGAARFFGVIAEGFAEDPDRCTRDLGQFIRNNPSYSFIGIIPPTGILTCSSAGRTYDFSQTEDFKTAFDERESRIVINTQAPLSGVSVFVISEPFEIGGEFAGFISISVPHSRLPAPGEELNKLGLEELMTFNSKGDVLTARSDIETALQELPVLRTLTSLKKGEMFSFQDNNTRGEPRIYTVVPIEGSPATAIGVWRSGDGLANNPGTFAGPALFPALMGLASLGVAMLSVYMLVLRHVTRLRLAMDRFTEDRHIDEKAEANAMPSELQALNQHFDRLTHNILRDEAGLEDALHDKNVLIKEVHHRVKNNLQLISSIMSMEIRAARQSETKSVLSGLQDRLQSLAAIHRDLYQSQNAGMVDASKLISEVVDNAVEIAVASNGTVDLETNIQPVLLYPDQAVPLSLLAAEGTTNIMKYLAAPEGEQPWIKVALVRDGEACELSLSNSIGGVVDAESTGLGSELINAFAIQLGAEVEIDEAPDSYTMRVSFVVQAFVPDERDY